MVDHAVLAFGAAEFAHLCDDFRHRIGLRANGAGAGRAAQRAHAAHHHLRLFAGQQGDIVLHRNQQFAAHHHGLRTGEIQRHHGNVFHLDVLPDVELGPVGERKNADGFALVHAAVKEVPQLRPLILGVPLPEGIAEGIDPLLGARLLFVAARAAESRVEAARRQGVEQGAGLQQAATFLRSQAKRIGAVGQRLAYWCGRSGARGLPAECFPQVATLDIHAWYETLPL